MATRQGKRKRVETNNPAWISNSSVKTESTGFTIPASKFEEKAERTLHIKSLYGHSGCGQSSNGRNDR